MSDIHIGQPDDDNISTRLTVHTPDKPVHKNCMESLKIFIQEAGIKFDGILNLGDVSNRGSISGWNMGIRMLRELALVSKCPLLSTPGNHDFCFDFKPSALDLLKSTNLYPTDKDNVNDEFWSKGFAFYRIGDLHILLCNSELYLHSKDNLNVSPKFEEVYIDSLGNYLQENSYAGPQLAMLHHHVIQHSDLVGSYTSNDIVERGDRFLDLLSKNNFSCVIHGHKHLSRYTTHNGMGILACGSLSSLENNRICDEHNYFHIITIKYEQANIRGKIDTFHFIPGKGWFAIEDTKAKVQATYGFGTPIDLEQLATSLLGMVGKNYYLDLSDPIVGDNCPDVEYLSIEDIQKLAETLNKQGYKLFMSSSQKIIFKQ